MKLHPTLSDREDQVLQLFACGLTATEVAKRLTLSVKTVSTYRRRILDKTELRTTAQLVQGVIAARAIQWIEATFGPLTSAQHDQLVNLYGDEGNR